MDIPIDIEGVIESGNLDTKNDLFLLNEGATGKLLQLKLIVIKILTNKLINFKIHFIEQVTQRCNCF